MTGKIFRSCLAVCVAAILLCTALFVAVMTDRNESEIWSQMKEEAAYAARGVEKLGLDYFIDLETEQRLTWIAADGAVLYDSVADESAMENHRDREEVRLALEQGEGTSQHISNTLLEKTTYYALRLEDGTVLRVACTYISLGARIIELLQPILWVVLATVILSGILSSRLARQITKPINTLDLEEPRTEQVYEELWPLVSRLREQNLTISRQMEELRRHQRELTALINNMGEGVLLLDRKNAILAGNQSAAAFLGEETLPNFLRRDGCRKELWEAAGKALAGRHGEELLRVDSRTVEILASPVTVSGYVTGAVLLIVDVTEREERENLRREFSANVSHELKTPLTAISGFAELMKEGLVGPDKMKEFAGDIYRESRQLVSLVEDIMKLSQLDEGAPEVSPEPVDLYTLSDEVLEGLRPAAAEQGVSLHLEGDHQQIHGVWRILREMLFNLCENAVKYNREGGRVTVCVSGDEETVCVSVQDTGIGISKGQQDRVFERFYRADKSHSRRIGGTGLGLSIVKHGAQYHNAKLSLDSEPGVGTTITLTFRKENGIDHI
ncbi:MAG: histidine kinase [Ruminiclostridium sp.]|nr:histidine kinase [Ruminiclostridium sp.]